MSYPTQSPQHPEAPAFQQQGPVEPPKQLRSAVTLMFVLTAIGVVSMVLDMIAGSIAMGELAGPYKKTVGEEISLFDFNPGTMYVNVLFALIIGGLALGVKKGSNGARITGAVFAILFMIGGLGGAIIGMLMAAGTDAAASLIGIDAVVPNWYIGVLALCLAQVVVSIIAMVKLFNRNTADYCTAPKS